MTAVPPSSGTSRRKSPHAAIQLLIALGLQIISMPFFAAMPDGDLIESILITLVMIMSVRAVGGRRRTHLIALALLLPALAGKWLNHFHHDLVSPLFYIAGAIVFFGFVVAHLLRFIVRSPRVDGNVLCAGVSGFLLLGMLWVPAYMLVAGLNPAAFNLPAGSVMNGFNAFYFSFITLCTVGYGDISPASDGARTLAVLEAITGLFYMAVLVSRLVSMHASNHPVSNPTDDDAP